MPAITGGLIAAGGGLLSGAGSYFGQKASADAQKQAAQAYLNYIQGQRDTFLAQPETGAIKSRLNQFIGGNVGYNPDPLAAMNQGTYEDYGKGLTDASRMARASAVSPGGTYKPGVADRTSRLLGENIATRRAEALRSTTVNNANVALGNERFAISALPTFMPGTPGTTVPSPGVFQAQNPAQPGVGNFASPIGAALTTFGNNLAKQPPGTPPSTTGTPASDAITYDQISPFTQGNFSLAGGSPYSPYYDFANRGGGMNYANQQ